MKWKRNWNLKWKSGYIYIYKCILGERDLGVSQNGWILGFPHKGIIGVPIGDPVLMILRNTHFRTWGQLWTYHAKKPDRSSTRGGFSDWRHVLKRQGHLGVS